MIEPTMNATPASTHSSWVTSTAAATFSTRPVIEILFGREARLDQPVHRVGAHLGAPRSAADAPPPSATARRALGGQAAALAPSAGVRQAHASGRARPNAALMQRRAATAATATPSAASSHQWLAVTSTTNVTSTG